MRGRARLLLAIVALVAMAGCGEDAPDNQSKKADSAAERSEGGGAGTDGGDGGDAKGDTGFHVCDLLTAEDVAWLKRPMKINEAQRSDPNGHSCSLKPADGSSFPFVAWGIDDKAVSDGYFEASYGKPTEGLIGDRALLTADRVSIQKGTKVLDILFQGGQAGGDGDVPQPGEDGMRKLGETAIQRMP